MNKTGRTRINAMHDAVRGTKVDLPSMHRLIDYVVSLIDENAELKERLSKYESLHQTAEAGCVCQTT